MIKQEFYLNISLYIQEIFLKTLLSLTLKISLYQSHPNLLMPFPLMQNKQGQEKPFQVWQYKFRLLSHIPRIGFF